MDLCSTGRDDHFFLAPYQIKVPILVEPAYVPRRHAIATYKCRFSLAFVALEIGGCNPVLTDGYDLTIRGKFNAHPGKQTPRGSKAYGPGGHSVHPRRIL